MSKPYLHKQDLILPIYRGHFVTIITNDFDKIKKIDPEFRGDQSTLYAHSIHMPWGKNKRDGYVIVLNFDNPSRPLYPGTIAHETVHIANMVAGSRGVIADFENDEPIAYLVEWLTDQVHYFINKKGFKVTAP